MVDFDAAMVEFCAGMGGFYRRYCDDILVLCAVDRAEEVIAFVRARINEERIALNEDKTEQRLFGGADEGVAQYLGFKLSSSGASLRESSLSRQWRKLRRSDRRTRRAGEAAMAAGRAKKIFTKKLRGRFSALRGREGRPVRDFSAYARRAADALEAKKVLRQVRRLERALECEIDSFPS